MSRILLMKHTKDPVGKLLFILGVIRPFAWLAVLVLVVLFVSDSAAFATSRAQQLDIPGRIVAQSGDAYIAYDGNNKTWEVGNSSIRRRTAYRAAAGYRLTRLTNKLTGREWLAPGSGTSAELHMILGGQEIHGSSSSFSFIGYDTRQHPDGSLELIVSLAHQRMNVHLHYAVYPGVSVIEQWAELENPTTTPVGDLTLWDSIDFALRPSSDALTFYWVQGLNPAAEKQDKKDPLPTLRIRSVHLEAGVQQDIGSSGRSSEGSMGWFALAAPELHEGMFGGIEWSGEWQLHVTRQGDNTALRAGLENIRLAIAPGETLRVPRRFIGFYKGDLDEAANASHAFARTFLLRSRPADFPWTQYNTWFAYYTNIDEVTLRAEVDAAAELGLEVFYVDAGWYEGSPQVADFSFGLGTWRENREKFPSGLAAFSDYVHSKGLKFGLWVEPERVDWQYVGPGKLVPLEWIAPSFDPRAQLPEGAARTARICLGNREAREWMKTWLARLIRDYRLDWLKWDDNLWMSCDPPGQTGSGELAHVVGLYEVLDFLRAEFPDLIIENCASGGNRMDYGLMRRTDIAWLSDDTEPSYRVRYHLTGASYPFPPEYLNSWFVPSYLEHLEDAETNPAVLRAWLRSRMMGAFGLSISIKDWAPEFRAAVAAEIKNYKSIRPIIATGVHYQLLPQSDLNQDLEPPTEPDAVEFFDPVSNTGAAFLFRGTVPWTVRRVLFKGLDPDTNYEITSADGTISERRTGRQLMSQSLRFRYASEHPSTLLFIKPLAVHVLDPLIRTSPLSMRKPP